MTRENEEFQEPPNCVWPWWLHRGSARRTDRSYRRLAVGSAERNRERAWNSRTRSRMCGRARARTSKARLPKSAPAAEEIKADVGSKAKELGVAATTFSSSSWTASLPLLGPVEEHPGRATTELPAGPVSLRRSTTGTMCRSDTTYLPKSFISAFRMQGRKTCWRPSSSYCSYCGCLASWVPRRFEAQATGSTTACDHLDPDHHPPALSAR